MAAGVRMVATLLSALLCATACIGRPITNPALETRPSATEASQAVTASPVASPSGPPSVAAPSTDAASPHPTTGPASSSGSPFSSIGTVRLMGVGDVMLDRTIGGLVKRDPERVFAGVAETFAEADVVVANLECAISTRGEPAPRKRFHFRAPPAAAGALRDAGIDVVGLANNHALDFGPAALLDTLDLLAAEGIAHAGAGRDNAEAHRPAFLDVNGLRLAFLSFLDDVADRSGWRAADWAAGARTPGLALATPEAIEEGVRSARREADVVVVMLHAGVEGATSESAAQRERARLALRAGAAVVLGAHPHILQPAVRRGSTLVAYSLGNFVFDGFTPPFHDSVIADMTLTADGVVDVRWVPVVLEDGLPRVADRADAARILRRLGPSA